MRLPIQNLQWNRQKQQTHRNWSRQGRHPERLAIHSQAACICRLSADEEVLNLGHGTMALAQREILVTRPVVRLRDERSLTEPVRGRHAGRGRLYLPPGPTTGLLLQLPNVLATCFFLCKVWHYKRQPSINARCFDKSGIKGGNMIHAMCHCHPSP